MSTKSGLDEVEEVPFSLLKRSVIEGVAYVAVRQK
jgi:hypothetical protein